MSFPLLEAAERAPMVDTSLSAFERIKPTLAEREMAVFEALWSWWGHDGATGGELAQFMGVPITSTRPRLTGLLAKGLVEKTAIRNSTVRGEGRCHGYRPTVPLAAVARAQQKQATS